jgi:hypothetical protein
MAVGRSACAVPAELAKTPERCAPPPSAAPSATPLASASAEPSAVEKRLGTEKYRAIRDALIRAFPSANVTDEVIGRVAEVLELPRPKRAAATAPEKEPMTRPVREGAHRLYLAKAVHHRVQSMAPASKAMESEFVKTLPVVRVALPDTLTEENMIIETEIGDVDLSNDHLLGSIDLIAAKYGDAEHLGWRPARVDLLTPARALGTRFGAIAVYLGYRRAKDRAPAFYLLEAGTATGDAKMIYFSPNMRPISSVTSYYLPTPFVTMRNTYSGGMIMRAPPYEDEPQTLVVESRVPGGKDPYITVTVSYERAPTMDLPVPVELTVNAAARVSAIARAMGVSSTQPLDGVLVELARTFYWIDGPRDTEPTTTPAAPPASASPAEPTPPQ